MNDVHDINFDKNKAKEYFLPFLQLKNYSELDYPLIHFGFKFNYLTLFIRKQNKQFQVCGSGFNGYKIESVTRDFNVYKTGSLLDCKCQFKNMLINQLSEQRNLFNE